MIFTVTPNGKTHHCCYLCYFSCCCCCYCCRRPISCSCCCVCYCYHCCWQVLRYMKRIGNLQYTCMGKVCLPGSPSWPCAWLPLGGGADLYLDTRQTSHTTARWWMPVSRVSIPSRPWQSTSCSETPLHRTSTTFKRPWLRLHCL